MIAHCQAFWRSMAPLRPLRLLQGTARADHMVVRTGAKGSGLSSGVLRGSHKSKTTLLQPQDANRVAGRAKAWCAAHKKRSKFCHLAQPAPTTACSLSAIFRLGAVIVVLRAGLGRQDLLWVDSPRRWHRLYCLLRRRRRNPGE